MTSASIISNAPLSELIRKIETSFTADRDVSASALAFVRDGVITGEGPTTAGRVHFSRMLDAHDAAWCARILTAAANANEPVSRAEAETLFEINDAASERSDDGRFDDLFAKAIVHHAAAASGLPVPPRSVALSPDTAVDPWAMIRRGWDDAAPLDDAVAAAARDHAARAEIQPHAVVERFLRLVSEHAERYRHGIAS